MEKHSHLRQRLRRARWAALGVALLGAVLVVFEDATPLARFSYDLVSILQPGRPRNEAVIVYVDDASFRELGREPDGTLGRTNLIRLVERCTVAGAKLVFLDFRFDTSNRVDEAFATALRTNGNVILGATYGVIKSRGRIEETIDPPVPPLRGAARGWGHLNLSVDAADHGPRQFPTLLNGHPPASWVGADALGVAPVSHSASGQPQRWLRYYGHADDVFDSVSLHRALSPKETPDEFFRGKIVFVGASSGVAAVKDEVVDEFKIPWNLVGDARVSGVVVHATCVMNLVRGDWLKRPARMIELLLVVLLGAGAVLLGAALWPWRHWSGVVALWVAVLALSLALPALAGAWWNWSVPALVQIPAAAFLTAWLNLRRLGPKLVFISYRTEDGAAYARSLQLGLRESGINAWLDKSDLPPGDYRKEILQHITMTRNYLLVLTPGVIERARENGSMLWEEMDRAGLTGAPRGTGSTVCPHQIIVQVDRPSASHLTLHEKAAEETPRLLQLAEVLGNPELRTFNTIQYNHDDFEGTMRKLIKGLSGLNSRQSQSIQDMAG